MRSFEQEFNEQTRARLVGSLVLVCGNRAEAEDIAQEALATAWSRWRTVATTDSPRAWVWRVAFNAAASAGRRRGAEKRAFSRLSTGQQLPPLPGEADRVALRDAVIGLPERQRQAIVCRYYSGLSVAETAQAMDCRDGTVKALCSQAIDRLRALDLMDRNEPLVEVADVGS